MSEIPAPYNTIAARIDGWHQQQNLETPPTRYHMGISGLGDPDSAGLWLDFRWAFKKNFDGRLLRLFRRGHIEEASVVSDLKAIGCDVVDTGDKQRFLDFGSHVGGSCDGVIRSGVPGAERTPHLLEIKTVSKKRFDELEKVGLEKFSHAYWVQVHCYMSGTGLERCLFYAVCKDDDRIYTERVKYDKTTADIYIARGQDIATADRMPERLPWGASDWRMKSNNYYAAYFPESAASEHWQRLAVQRDSKDPLLARICINYRTDATSTPRPDGTWFNERWQSVIPNEYQHTADEGHVLHPDIMALAGWTLLDSRHPHVARYRLPGGQEVLNGDPELADGEPIYTSEELLANPEACAAAKTVPVAQELRQTMGGRVVG